VKSRRPYLLRAMHEWISDSDCTPHIVVDASMKGVDVRGSTCGRQDRAEPELECHGTAEHGQRRNLFQRPLRGASMTVRIPVDAVLAVYARETGQGMIFAEDESGPPSQPPEPTQPPKDRPPEPPQKPVGRAKLKVVK